MHRMTMMGFRPKAGSPRAKEVRLFTMLNGGVEFNLLPWRQVMEEELGRLLSGDALIASSNYGAGFNRATIRRSLYQRSCVPRAPFVRFDRSLHAIHEEVERSAQRLCCSANPLFSRCKITRRVARKFPYRFRMKWRPLRGESSNQLLETLEEWNVTLSAQRPGAQKGRNCGKD